MPAETSPAAAGSRSRQGNRRRSRRGGQRFPFSWIVDSVGLSAAVLSQAFYPGTWRRPVRDRFIETLDGEGVRALPTVIVAAMLTGIFLIAQGLYWLQELGQTDQIRDVLLAVLMREIAPLVVAILMIGRSGLTMLGQLSRLVADGQVRALDAMGVDPLHYLVLPYALALSLASFCLMAVFVGASIITGFVSAELIGLTRVGLGQTLPEILDALVASNPLSALLKSLVFGFAIGCVVCATALESGADQRRHETLLSRGFFRALLSVVLFSVALSMAT